MTTTELTRDEKLDAQATNSAFVAGLGKTFVSKGRTVRALNNLDLLIARGEYVVVLGPSGCGKSTLLRCIAGLEKPTAGRISLPGQVVFDQATGVDVAPRRRNVSMVFQNYALWPHMTVEKNVAYPLRMRKVPKSNRTRRTSELLKALECEVLAKRLPAELSGGQQQRIALARALVSEPGILLLDEPLSNLDALLRVTLRAELLRLHRKLGFTALHITHDQEEALEMGDRVVLMREGRIEQMGPPEEVYARPVSPYAANFLGVRNRLDVTVGAGRLDYRGGPISGTSPLVDGWKVGDGMQLFVRNRDVHISDVDTAEEHHDAHSIRLEGTLAQIVLGDGGRRQYIVDVGGEQWFAQRADSTELSVGDKVSVTAPRTSLLLYHGEERVLTELVD
ncbi:MAG: ABC transporter ATP-binding protein [Rhodococcus sp. (in: high G+C Gram-positive bacteria)]|nr:MAG: ABC transporter ATP-binding protein [Rhodococcus sp. (in: high G+C Gram-positive bacteria)]